MKLRIRSSSVTYASSAFGGLTLAAATIKPNDAIANVSGWFTLISGSPLPQTLAWLLIAVGVLALSYFVTVTSLRMAANGDLMVRSFATRAGYSRPLDPGAERQATDGVETLQG